MNKITETLQRLVTLGPKNQSYMTLNPYLCLAKFSWFHGTWPQVQLAAMAVGAYLGREQEILVFNSAAFSPFMYFIHQCYSP